MSYEQRRIGDVIVTRTRILGTNRDVFTAWEPGSFDGYFTVSSLGEEAGRYGRIDTKFVPEEFETLVSLSEHRRRAATLWRKAQHQLALAYIYAAFPELISTPHSLADGKIYLEGEPI